MKRFNENPIIPAAIVLALIVAITGAAIGLRGGSPHAETTNETAVVIQEETNKTPELALDEVPQGDTNQDAATTTSEAVNDEVVDPTSNVEEVEAAAAALIADAVAEQQEVAAPAEETPVPAEEIPAAPAEEAPAPEEEVIIELPVPVEEEEEQFLEVPTPEEDEEPVQEEAEEPAEEEGPALDFGDIDFELDLPGGVDVPEFDFPGDLFGCGPLPLMPEAVTLIGEMVEVDIDGDGITEWAGVYSDNNIDQYYLVVGNYWTTIGGYGEALFATDFDLDGQEELWVKKFTFLNDHYDIYVMGECNIEEAPIVGGGSFHTGTFPGYNAVACEISRGTPVLVQFNEVENFFSPNTFERTMYQLTTNGFEQIGFTIEIDFLPSFTYNPVERSIDPDVDCFQLAGLVIL